MGSWGYGVLDDDMARDVYETYLDAFKKGAPPDELHAALVTGWLPQVEGSHEEMPFWLGLAKAMWECGALSEVDVRELEEMIASDMAVRGYADVGGEQKRRAVMHKFLALISVPRAKPRQPLKRLPRPVTPLLKPGACLVISVGEKLFGAAVMVQINDFEPNKPWYRLVLLRRLADTPPLLPYFESRDWLIEDRSHMRRGVSCRAWDTGVKLDAWPDRPTAYWCRHSDLKKSAHTWKDVGILNLGPSDPVVLDLHIGECYSKLDSVVHCLRVQGVRQQGSI